MAREPDPESRPISVAEILARRAAEDAAGDPPSAGDASANSAPTGRRRRGSEGSVSVAELTGEIPRIRGGAHSGSFRAIDRDEVEAPAPAPEEARVGRRRRAEPVEDEAPADVRPVGVGDELSDAAPSTDHLAAASAFVPDEPHVPEPPARSPFPRSDRPTAPGHDGHFPRSGEPRPTWGDDAGAWSRPAGPDTPPATRDLNSADVRDRFTRSRPEVSDDADTTGDERADEVTGIIPRFGAPHDPDGHDPDDLAGMTQEERDRAFESYRNFDDVDVDEETPRRRRGLFGALRRPRPDSDTEATAVPDDDVTMAHTNLLAGGADDRLEAPDDTPTELTDVAQPEWGARAWSDTADVDDEPERASEAPWTTRFAADPTPDTGVVDLDKAQGDVRPAWRGADSPRADDDATPDTDRDTDHDTAEPSAGRQWAMLGLQIVLGLLVGVGLFLGFTELWRWNVYFALVLAIVVVFGLVTFVHVVRRSSDLLSTLIALAVGLIVTLGPLALLASGS
ncbi:hypothetical protein ACXVUM_03905 [Williamsia sp. SKLECPSW1]